MLTHINRIQLSDCTSRGPDIGWLSVYPNEKEALSVSVTIRR